MEKSDQVNWGCFHLGELYSVSRPQARNKDDYNPGDVPFVASGSINNGIMKYCKPREDEILDAGGCITVSPVDGSAFYQPINFLGRGGAGSSILILRRKGEKQGTGIFIARAIRQTCSKYTYGHMGNKESIIREQIQLPVNVSGEPDYHYMAKYVELQRMIMLEKYRAYAKKRIAELGPFADILTLEEKEWLSFSISDIFHILPGKRLVASDTTSGNRPFIGALDNSNGVARFVSDTNSSLDRNVLGVNYNGNGMVIGFYHPYECIFSDDVKRFHLKKYEDNAYVLLFMKVVILQQKSKFGYLYKFNADRMANTRIMLPVDDDGKPDYSYMEQYAKNMMLRKYEQYLNYLNRTQAST